MNIKATTPRSQLPLYNHAATSGVGMVGYIRIERPDYILQGQKRVKLSVIHQACCKPYQRICTTFLKQTAYVLGRRLFGG
jgi:hypothetical protein